MQQYLTEVLQHLNATPGTAWSGFYTSIVFVVLLPVLVYLGQRCWGRRDKSEQPVNTFTSSGEQNVAQGDRPIGKQINNYYGGTSSPVVKAVIPHDPPTPEPCFLHRETELVWLNERLHPGAVVAVCGPGGMGKSALAAQAVSKLEPARFPDGIVFHSFYHQASTETALQAICAAFQVEAKAGLETTLRTVLSGKQALLILDGTEEADDLPAVLRLRGACGVLITSRKNADAPDALLELKPLDEQPAEEVFLRYSGPVTDAASVAAICKLLHGWPVALRIAGRYLRSTKESAADYLRWLEKKPFKKLGDGQHKEDNIALLLGRSVAQVSADAVQALRLAGVLAFAPISLGPVMAVVGKEDEDPDDVELRSTDALGELVSYGLMEKPGEGWQISHALIHTYARTELALSKEKLERLAHWYIDFCETQSKAGLEGYARLDGERAHCLRLMESCLDGGLWQRVQDLAWALEVYLYRQGYWTEELAAFEMALTASRQAGDRNYEVVYLSQLGLICNLRGEYDKVIAYDEQRISVDHELGDRYDEGLTLNSLAATYKHLCRYELAVDYYKQCLTIYREVGDRVKEIENLEDIANLYYDQGDYDTALQYYKQGLLLKREIGDKIGEGGSLNNIAAIYDAQGKPAKALEYHEQALAIAQEFGDRAGEANRCWNIGLTYEGLGDLAKAEDYISQAVQIEKEIGSPYLENDRKILARVRAKRQGARSSMRRKGVAALWHWLRGKRKG